MSPTPLTQVRIVIVEPAGAINVGSIARIMKNMGLSRLVLVDPRCDPFSEDARNMAVHAIDVLESAQIVKTLPEALIGVQRAIATTVRERSSDLPLEPPRTALPWLLESDVESALLFGSEYRGLSNDELKYAQRCISIDSSPIYRSLNLAQAVAICCYELYQLVAISASHTSEGTVLDPKAAQPTASLDVLEQYYQQLEDTLLKIGYLQPHTASSRMEKFRRMFNRATLTDAEVAMLRGILRQIEWAANLKN